MRASQKNEHRRALIQRAREFRRKPTQAEINLWRHLKNRQLGGYKFRRQHRIDRFIVDFCCLEAKLVIELDGSIHQTQKDYDLARTQRLEDLGFRVLRFRNKSAFEEIQNVLEIALEACESAGQE